MGESFNEGFRRGLSSGEGVLLPFFFILLGFILMLILYKYIKTKGFTDLLKKGKNIILDNFTEVSIFDSNELNPIQRKILYDIIEEYKRKNYYSQNIADAEYELFGEYLLQNSNRLKISKSELKEIESQHFPLIKTTKIEIDFEIDNKKFIVETSVLATDDKTITAKFISIAPENYSNGQKVTINYNINKLFISGESYIKGIYPGKELVLSRPKKLKVANERRYQRYTMSNLKGFIFSSITPDGQEVDILDLSTEGVKIRSTAVLKKNIPYKLTFKEEIDDYAFEFNDLLCYISKTFIATGGYFEYGMIFFYTLEEKFKLYEFLKKHVKANVIKK